MVDLQSTKESVVLKWEYKSLPVKTKKPGFDPGFQLIFSVTI